MVGVTSDNNKFLGAYVAQRVWLKVRRMASKAGLSVSEFLRKLLDDLEE